MSYNKELYYIQQNSTYWTKLVVLKRSAAIRRPSISEEMWTHVKQVLSCHFCPTHYATAPHKNNSLPSVSISIWFIFVLLSMFETLDLQTSLVTVTRPLPYDSFVRLYGHSWALGQVFAYWVSQTVQFFIRGSKNHSPAWSVLVSHRRIVTNK